MEAATSALLAVATKDWLKGTVYFFRRRAGSAAGVPRGVCVAGDTVTGGACAVPIAPPVTTAAAALAASTDCLPSLPCQLEGGGSCAAAYPDAHAVLAGWHWTAILLSAAYHTMVSSQRLVTNFLAVDYAVAAGIEGAILEVGVAKGGSAAVMGLTAAALGDPRQLHLYDTFSGLPPPTVEDGEKAVGWAGKLAFPLDGVKEFMASTGLPADMIAYHVGDVVQTPSGDVPCSIAVLRIDTDFYASSVWLLDNFYPRVPPGSIVLLDDYVTWLGQRVAVDEFLARPENAGIVLHIGDSGAAFCKPGGQRPCPLVALEGEWEPFSGGMSRVEEMAVAHKAAAPAAAS